MRSRRLLASIVVLALVPTTNVRPAEEPQRSPQGYFPVRKGNTWIYRGTVRDSDQDGPSPPYRVELRRTIIGQRELEEGAHLISLRQTARVLGDGPDAQEIVDSLGGSSLLWFMDGLRVHGRKVYELSPDAALERTGRKDLRSVTAADLRTCAKSLVPDFIFPVMAGQRYDNGQEPLREDGYYQWIASKGRPVKIAGKEYRDVLALCYRSLPGVTEVDFVPGVGVARMKYQHNGTIIEWELRLVRYYLTPL